MTYRQWMIGRVSDAAIRNRTILPGEEKYAAATIISLADAIIAEEARTAKEVK